MKLIYLFKGLFLIGLTTFLSACGNSSLVEKISVQTGKDFSQDTWVTLNTQLNMGALIFPGLLIPVSNPKFPSEMIGKVQLQRSLDGKNILSVSANISEFEKIHLEQDNLLPNGYPIPVVGLTSVVAARFNSNSKIYLGGSEQSLMFGISLAIPLFDNIGKYLVGINLFLPLPAESKIEGLGGVFTGGLGQNGLGLFVKVPNGFNTMAETVMAKSVHLDPAVTDGLKFQTSNETSKKSISLKKYLFSLSLQPQLLKLK